MRKLLVIALLVNAALLGVACWHGIPSAQAGEGPPALENGDTNEDGARDIGDAVYLLSWLFLGGPAPVEAGDCEPPLNGDTNGDDARDIGDAVYLLSWLFLGGPEPVAVGSCEPTLIEWVTVGDPSNNNDEDTGFGSVDSTYRISKYEVTNLQWTVFLNSVDPLGGNALGLYATEMEEDPRGGISQAPTHPEGSRFVVKPSRSLDPVVFVDWYGCVRFCNWLHNGQGDGDTENGAYTLEGETAIPTNEFSITRNDGAQVFLPSEDEWYKAAYYDPSASQYFDYPTGSNTAPTCEVPPGGANSSNCESAVGGLAAVGSYSGSTSPFGTLDQCGNIFEWLEDENEPGSELRGIRSGGWLFFLEFCRSSRRNGLLPGDRSLGLGFRPAGRLP
jgi:formylglycine-generating enzyme required for sulfatase activity